MVALSNHNSSFQVNLNAIPFGEKVALVMADSVISYRFKRICGHIEPQKGLGNSKPVPGSVAVPIQIGITPKILRLERHPA
jgi:hypothetical protein